VQFDEYSRWLISPRQWVVGTDKLVRPIWRAVLFVVFGFAFIVLVSGAIDGIGQGWPHRARLAAYHSALIAMLLLETWFLLSVFDRRSFRTVGLWFFPGWGRQLLLGTGIGAGLIVAVVGVLVAGQAVAYRGLAVDASGALVRLVAAAGILLLAAAFEEIAFRGYGFQRLVDSVGPVAAVAIFSALFGFGHLGNPSATPLSTANTLLAGVLLSLAYLKTRALWLPIGLHWAWNFFLGAIFSLPVSGFRLVPPLLVVQLTGPPWLNGGAYGPEGSVVLTLACVGAIGWVARIKRISASAAMDEVLE